MMSELLRISGLELDENKQKIIEDEFLEMTKKLEILACFSCKTSDHPKNITLYQNLRNDIIIQSSEKEEILSNSKSKKDDGFVVTKII